MPLELITKSIQHEPFHTLLQKKTAYKLEILNVQKSFDFRFVLIRDK